MIAIRYSGKKLLRYNDMCRDLQKQIEKWCKKGYIGNRRSRIKMYKKTKEFFGNLDVIKLANMSPQQIEDYIDSIERDYPELVQDRCNKSANSRARSSNLYKCLYKAFSNYGYDSNRFPSDELIDDLGLVVCPYCNRNFIKSIPVRQNRRGDDVSVKGQLDHFYPRSLYPYLAICKYNLIPSCPSCNGASGKHNGNPRELGIISPYLLENNNGLKFMMNITGEGFANMLTCAKAISIDVDCTACPDLANNEKIFHLKKLYNTHTDYAAEIYYKSLICAPSYRKSIEKIMANNEMNFNMEDFERILLSVYTNEDEYHKRPLSKFCTDLAKQNKLIP